MKNYIVMIIALVAITISIFAFINQPVIETKSTLSKMKSTGKLNICYVVYPPTVIKDASTGQLSGHMIDTIESILSPIEVKPVYHEQSWGSAAMGLQSGICDIVTAAFFINPTRAYAVDFTEPLFYIGDVALVATGDSRFETVYDADKEGITIAVANGESGHEFVKNNFKNAKINVIDVEGADMSRLALEVSSGKADIALAGAGNLEPYAEKHDDVEIIFSERPFNNNPVAWAVRQDDTQFLNFIENSLNVLEVNKKLQEFEDRYDAKWLHEVKTFELR